MIDNLLGSLDYTAKLPTDIKVNTDLPKFRDLTPVNINNLLADNQKDDQLSFDDLLRRNEQKYGRTEELNKPYFINRYEYERYINSDKDNGSFFNWKPNPIFKNPLYFDNEELNAQQQSGLRQFINGTSKALPSMISSFVEGLNPIPGTKEGEFQKWIHDWSKQLEYTHPNYYSKQEKDNPFAISTILDGNFWGDKVLKNAGFTIGAIGAVLAWDAAISAATLGSGTAPATAIAIGKGISMISKRFSTAQKLINGVNEASMVGKAIKSSNLAYEGLKNYSLGQKALTYSKLGFLNYVGSNSEASIEGYEGLESLNDELISEFIKREGRKPEAFEYANMKDIARQMANTRYSINLPLLMITNAIEFGSLFSPSKLLTTGGIGFGERLATDAAGKIFKRGFKDFTVLEKLGYSVTNPLVKNFLAESFQEGTQYSIEKATRDLGFKKFQNPNFRVGLSEYMESQALGIKKTFSETEGLESMLIGGITGAITTGFTSSWDKFISKQSEKESKILDETINEYNTLTEEGILDSKYFKDYMTRVVERDQINFDGTLTHLTIEAQIQKAIEDKNVFAFKALQHDKLFNLVSLATRLDKLDAFKLKIEQLRGLSTEELAQNLGIQNLDEEQIKRLSGVIDEYVDLVQNKVEQMSDIIKVVNNSLINNFDPEKDELKFHAFNDLKNTFAFQLSNISDIKGRISEEMDNLLSDKMNPLSESLINTLLGQEESEQTLIIDDFTKNFVSEKGFDLSILDNKYTKPYIEQLNALNSEISTLNLSIESAKAAKLPYEGYKSKLNQKKKQLADFVEFLSEFNNKIQTFSETLKNSQDFTEASNIDAFKDLTSHVIKYEMNKDLNNPISISKADEIVEAIADLHLLNSSLKLFINDNNKFQTPKGQSEYLDEYIKWKSFAENKVQEAVRKANFETLKRQKPESINLAKSQISSNISEIEEINAQLQILNEQLKDTEDKESIQKQIDELKAKKEELKKQNEELEKVADALENDKELDNDLEKRKKDIEYSIDQLEKDIEDRKKELIKNGASEKDAEKIARKEFNESDGGKNKIALEKLYEELDKVNNQLEQKEENIDKLNSYLEQIPTIEESIDKNIIINKEIKEFEAARLRNSKTIQEKIEILEKNKKLYKIEHQSIQDTLNYLNQLLDNTSNLAIKDVSIIQNEIDKLLNTIKSNSKKNTYRGDNTIRRIAELKKSIKDEFSISNDITNRIRVLKENLNQLELIQIDVQNQINYYYNLLNNENFKTLSKSELLSQIDKIERKKTIINKLINLLKKAINQSIDYLKGWVDNVFSNITNLETFVNVNNFKVLNQIEIKEKIESLNSDLDNYTALKKQYDLLEAQVNKSIDDVNILEKIKDGEQKRLIDLENKLQKYNDQIRYIQDLLNNSIKERNETSLSDRKINKSIEKRYVEDIQTIEKQIKEEKIKKIKEDVVIDRKNKKEPVTETKSIKIQPVEIVTPTSKKSIDLDLESKEDEFITQIDKQEFNGRVHFLRTTDVEIYDKPEKDGKGGRTRRFQLFLEQFLISNGLSQIENLNNWLSNNNLKFVIMRPTDEMYDDRTFDEKYKALDNQSKSAVLVLVDKDNKPVKLKDGKIDESGDFIAEVLPTKKEKSKWNDQLQYIHDSEYKQLHNAVNSIKSSENPSPITVNITGVANGLYRFMTDVNGKVDKNPSPLTKSILDNPASELFVNTSSEDIKFGGFNLQRGKLYLKVSNKDKTYFYFPIQLGKISETKLGNSIHSILEYVFKNHKTLKEENDTLLKDIDLFLETVLYNGVKINNLGLEINFHLNSENPYFKIERVDKENKTQTLLYDLDSLTNDKKLFLNFLKGLDINSKTFDKTEQIEVPILNKNGLRIEKQSYKDFLLENTNPTIPFKIDLSKGFDRVKQAVYFDIQEQNELLSNAPKSAEQGQIIPEQVQSEIDAKKADIERRRKEALDKANKQIEKTNKKEDRRVKVETYRTLDIGGNPVEVEITTNADGSRVLRARQVNEDGSIEPMAYVTERINNKSQATLTNEKLIEGYIGNEDNTLQRTNVDENPNQTHIDKINAKYDSEYVDAVKKGEMTKEQAIKALEEVGRKNSAAYAELAALGEKETPNKFKTQDVIVKKDEKSNWNLTVNSDGTVLNKNTNKLLDKRLDKNLINKAHLKSGFLKYEKVIASNKKEYAVTEDGRVISLAKTSLGTELDVENSSIAKDALKKSTKFKVETPVVEEIKSDNPSISIDGSTLTQDVTKDTPKEKKKFNKNNDSTPLFSSKKIPVLPSLNVTQTDIEKVRSLFPYEVNIKNLFNIANSDAWATWSQSAITLFKGATRADLYHEAWHHFSQLYLTKDEKVRLYSETRQRVKELIGKSDLEVEEYIAREFAKFTETGKIEGNYPERKSIFQKIMDFLKSIFSNETDLSLDSLFNNLYKGQVNPLNYSTDNIMFGKLNSSINDNFSASETDVLFPALDALKSQLLKEYNVSDSEMYKIKNVNRIYNEIQDHIIELYEKSENPIITSKLEKVLDNWEDVKKSHLEYVAKQRGIKSEVEIDENGQLSFKNENEDEKQGRNSADFSEGSEKTIYDLMDEDVKSLIRGLVDKDSKGNEIVDPIFGLPRLVDFSKYVELLKDSFDDSQDLNQMLEKMTELSKKYPAIKDLIDRLFVNESNDVKNLRIKFVSSLGLVKNPIIQGLVNENKVITAVQASTSKKREAEYDTKSYFYQAKPTSLIESVDGENVIKSTKLEAIKNYNISEQKDQINFLKDIGIEIDNLLPNLENRDKKLLFNLNTFQYLKDHIVKYLSEKGDIKNIVDALQTTLKDGKKEDKVYKLLVNLKQKRLPQYISGAYLNASNKLEQEKTQWSTMDKVLVSLSKSNSIQDLISNPNLAHLKGFLDGSYLDMQSSKLLSYLFNGDGTRTSNKLTKNNYNGIASTDENKDGLKTKTMYIKDKVLMDIALFANSNHLTTMQLSNKASHFTFGFDKVLIDNETEFVNAMYGYLLDELKIIKEFDNGNEELTKLKKLKGNILKDGKYQFAIFKDIITATENNPDFAQNVINQYLKNGELKDDVKAIVVKQIKDFLNDELNSTVDFIGADFLAELKVDENNRRYKDLNNRLILKDYIQNQLVFNIEMSKLVFGNPYMHTDPFKRIAGASSTGRSILSDDVSIEYYKQMTTSTQRSKVLDILHSKVGGEYKLQTRKSEKEIRYFVAKDREIQSDYYSSILKLIDEQIAKNPDNLELKEKRKAIESAYNKVNGSDAMGACTLDFWRKSSVLSGRWDFKSLEPFYQKMINWDYYNRLMKSTEDSEKKLEYFTERQKNELTDDEIINVAVLKYQYYGTVENNSIAEKAFHKFQLMPLIPQVIEGKNWSNHVDRMIYEDVDYMMFESASKLERDDKLDDFYIENSNKSANFDSNISKYRNGTNSYNIKTGFLDNLKEQVFMENGSDDSNLFGSQVRKLLFVTNDFSELYDEFRNTIQSLTDIEKDNLKKLSGLDDEGKVTDNQKFVKFLLDEIDKKTVNKNVREYLRLTNEGNFAHSLDTNIQRQPIESIINSVINSRLIKQKMHGEMLVQVSNVGFESLEDGKGLKFYSLENGKVRKMQVKVPLTGKFKNLLNLVVDGQKVGTRERLNQLLKEGKIDTRSITMVGYRIPTQEHNSMEIMEVEEFLHPSLNAIVVPYEITAKAGSDFDIDKLNIFKPHIDENGYYVEKKFNSKSEAVDNYLQTKERINPLIKDIRIEKFNWQSNLVQETERVKKDIFERIQTLKNDLSFYKGQLRDNIVFNAMVYEKNQIINQMYQLFDDYRALRNKEDIGEEYEYRRGNPDYKYKDTLKFTVNKEVREYLNRTNSSFIKALFDEYTDISDETPIYDVKNEIVNKYNDRLSALLNVVIALDAEFINNEDLKNKINELNGTKGYDSTGTFTGVSGEIQNLYSQLNSVFTNSKSAKIFIKGEMPEELKQIYEKIMGYQFELSEELNKLYIDKNQAFLDMVNFKNSNQNRIIEIFEKVLLDPSNYLNLITPNSTFMFDGAMDNIFEALYPNDIQTKKGKKMPKDLNLTKSLLPRSSWQTKAILDEAGQALGIAAVGNTFTQLIQKSNVEFTESYLSKFNLLFKPESISKRTLSNGLSKATAYSQTINIYVDIANDPRAGYLNMGDRVIPIINTMINMGLPIDTILYFINQPIIRDFVEYEGMVKNSLFKGKEKVNVYKEFIKTVSESSKYDFGSVVKLTKNLEEGYVNYSRFIESKQTYADVSYLLQKEGVEHDFSNENLKSTLREKPNGINREDYSKQQLLLLSQYLQLSEISSDYRQLQSSMNFDTTLAKDGFDSEERERLFNEVVKKDIFTNLGDLKNKTVIAPLNISNYLTNVNKTLLPLTNSTVFYNSLSKKLSTNYQYSTTKVKSRFVRTFKNDLISYIFQNFVTRSDKASLLFNETFAPVLGEYENKPNEFGLYLVKNLYKDLIKLRNENPELKNQYSILDKLFIISENEFKNIGLSYFNKDSQLQDSYIEQFKELLNHQNSEVRNFMLKFAYMSFFQSGLNKSFISSSDIIPAYIFAPILDAAREQFYKEVNSPAKENAILEDFFNKFLQNNDRFRANDDNRGKSDKNILKEKSDRGKWYVSNVGEVLNPTLSVLDKQKVDLTNAIEFEGYYILDNKVYNNQGIEVYNPDVLQDFKLEKIKPTEEQQKVIDRVKEFIKSPNKELLSPENVLMISGAGGTGKTFSITRAARQLQKEKYVSIAFSAPTHNAKRELQKSLNDVYGKNRETAHTNASLFALDYNPITGKTTKRIINESFPPEYWNKSVIILDEYSMLGGELWKMIQERLVEKQEKGYGHTKIIFTGDYAQIPVPDSSRKEFMDGDVTNWIFHNRKDRVEALYTNMRAKFADLADTSAKIRTYIDRINNTVIYKTTQEKPEEIIKDFNNTFIKNKETSVNVKYYNSNNKIEWLDSYIDAYKTLSNKNPYFGVIVNYNNSAHINNINLTKKIREQLFGLKSNNRFNEGELLIIDNNTLNAGLGTLGKDMRVYVESINKTKRKQNFSYKAKGIKGEKYFSIEFDAYQITATTDGEDVLTFYVPIINETVLDKYKNQDFDFLNIQGEKPENINQLIAIIDPNIAQVSYGYVVNSHKVQGSSYDQVWVQEDNILTAREPKEVLQLLYTAYSRPKYKTHSLNKSSSVEIKEIFEPLRTELENQPAITEQIGEVKTMNEIVNHSGGAYGGDTFWDIIGREFGVTEHRHYKDAGNQSLSKQLRDKGIKAEVLSKEQMDKARTEVENLLGKKYPDTLQGNLQVRNYFQVANSNAVFAIAKIASSTKPEVYGGTNTAVQLGIRLNKPVYVWDIDSEKWYTQDIEFLKTGFDKTKHEWNYNGWVEIEIPTLTKNFAGVGSRDIEGYNVQDKETGKWQLRKEYVGKEKEEKAKQAIRDVYKKTLQELKPNVDDNKEITKEDTDKLPPCIG